MSRRTHRLLRSLKTLTRRLTLWLLLPFSLLLATRLLWGLESSHRLNSLHARLRAQGIRFEHPLIASPDDQNPALALNKAFDLINISVEELNVLEGDGTVPWDEKMWTPAQIPKFQAILSRNQAAFHWLEIAAHCTGPIPPSGGAYDKNLAKAQSLAMLLGVAAILHHQEGDDLECLHDLQHIYAVAFITDHGGDILHNLVAIAIRAMLAQAIEQIEPTLKLRADDGSVAQAQALLKMLLDPDPIESPSRNAESQIGYSDVLSEEDIPLDSWWVRPLKDDEIGRSQQTISKQIDGFRAQDWPTAQKYHISRPPIPADTNLNVIIYWGHSFVPFAIERIMTLHFRRRAENAAATILLSSRLYALQHGHLPATLADLTPEFLPTIPLDPFSPSHAPMHFRLDPDGPTVWSVGENLTDEGGPVRFSATGNRLSRYDNSRPTSQPDIIFGAAWRTAKPPATAPTPP